LSIGSLTTQKAAIMDSSPKEITNQLKNWNSIRLCFTTIHLGMPHFLAVPRVSVWRGYSHRLDFQSMASTLNLSSMFLPLVFLFTQVVSNN